MVQKKLCVAPVSVRKGRLRRHLNAHVKAKEKNVLLCDSRAWSKNEKINKNIFVMSEMLITAYPKNSNSGSCLGSCTLGSMYHSAFPYHKTETGSRVRTPI